MVKIDVVSGFLGAGKTTFIRKLISEALKGEKIVLIENEFGEISIDGGFLKDSGIEIREMSQGCICCSLVGDFEKSLKEVIERFEADRIIIEPSGVGKLSDVMKAVTEASASLDVSLNSAVTIVDAKKCRMYMKNFGEFFINQIQYAGTIVLTRTDIVDDHGVEEAVRLISGINDRAEIITTPVSKLKGERLLEIMEKHDSMLEEMMREALNEPDGESEEEHEHHHHHHEGHEHGHCEHHEHHEHHEGHKHHEGHECCGHHDHDDHEHHEGHECCGHHEHGHGHEHGHDADEVFESCGFTNVPKISGEKLESILKELSEAGDGVILRAKGMLEASDKDTWYYFDMVPGEYEIREGLPDYTGKVCIIGSGLDGENLKHMFFD